MRGWSDFLTDRDKEHLVKGGWEKKELFGFGQKPALLLIDIYYSVLGLEREPILESVKKWPMSCGLEGWEAVDRTAELLAVARENDIPVIHVHGLDGFPSPWGRRKKGNRLSHLPEEMQAKANVIVEEVAPIEGELVIQKAAASAFHGTPLSYHLNYLGIDTVVACGETTSGCVRASVVDGATYRYRMGVVEDCCFDRTQASHYINLFDMHQKYADVVDLDYAKEYFLDIGKGNTVAEKAV